jgi:uncharacterized protein with HEPN domain
LKDDRFYLEHILECIARVEQYTASGKECFAADARTQDAVLRNLQIMAESTSRLSRDLKAKHPEVNWRTLSAFRNVMVHDYLGIDLSQIWDIVGRDVPGLKRQVEAILRELTL